MADRRKWMVLVVAAVCLGQVAASGGSAPASDIVQRSRRYPLHLDPLYQYRFLARSRHCPSTPEDSSEYYCPTPDKSGNWRCIDDFQLCDGLRHCPNGEDELPMPCLFYRVVETHLNSVSQRLVSEENRREREQLRLQQQQQQQQQQQLQKQQHHYRKKNPR